MPSMALRLRVFRDKIEGIIANVLFFSKGGEGDYSSNVVQIRNKTLRYMRDHVSRNK